MMTDPHGAQPDHGRYTLTCVSCGQPFQAQRRNAQTCSERCRKRLIRGHFALPPSTGRTHDPGRVLYRQDSPDRLVYVLYRGTLSVVDVIEVTRKGMVAKGAFAGRRLIDLIKTADERGWLVYKRRPDGWYAAEWNDGRIVLCGPQAKLPGSQQIDIEASPTSTRNWSSEAAFSGEPFTFTDDTIGGRKWRVHDGWLECAAMVPNGWKQVAPAATIEQLNAWVAWLSGARPSRTVAPPPAS